MKILTIFYGGVWKLKDGEGSFQGEMKSKAFVIDDTLELHDLKLQIISRFKIDVEVCDLILAHLHPSQKLTSPYTVEDNEDLQSFIVINESIEVPWSLPLYASSTRSSCKTQSQHVMTDHHGDDIVHQSDIPIHRNLHIEDVNQQHDEGISEDVNQQHDEGINDVNQQHDEGINEGVNQQHDEGDDTFQQDKDIDDTFDVATAQINQHASSTRSSCKTLSQHVMTDHHGDDIVHQLDIPIHQDLPIEDANQHHDEGNDTFQHDKDIDDTFDAASAQFNQHGRSTVSDFLYIGEIFNSKEEVKVAIQNLAIRENFAYKVNKSTRTLLKLKCVDKHCKWNFRAAKLQGTEIFEIRRYNDVHTCTCTNRCQPSYRFIAEQIKGRYASGVKGGPDPKSIQNDMRNDYSQNISYWKAWKAKEWAQNLIRGTPESNYRLLPSYLYILKQVNPGTYTSFEVTKDDRFKCAFVSIGACIRGFTFMRKVIMVDGIHLHGKYLGYLMMVTSQDANNQIYPLAFAVVDSENDVSWTWFFEQLHKVIPSTNSLVIVSNGRTSIAKSIEKVYTSAIQVVCTRHLKEHLKNSFKNKGIHSLFTLASESYTEIEFQYYFNKISEMSPEMREYLEGAKIERWTRTYCRGERYNIMTRNNSESLNTVLKEARSYQLVALLEYIRDMLSRWFCKRKELVEKNLNQLPPHVRGVVEGRSTESTRYEVKCLNNMQFEVVGGKFTCLVDLSQKTCSCRVFDLDHIPCAHALAAIQKVEGNISDFVDTYYHYFTWANSYQETILPVPVRTEWVIPNDVTSIACYPPFVEKKSGRVGRPRKRRQLFEGESGRSVTKKTRKTVKCGVCGNLGHNKASCKFKASSSN